MASVTKNGLAVSNAGDLEAMLRRLLDEQLRLRSALDQTRQDLDRVNAKILQAQEDYCTDSSREDEYCECIKRILGLDPREVEAQIQQVLANGYMNGADELQNLIAELEADDGVRPAKEAE